MPGCNTPHGILWRVPNQPATPGRSIRIPDEMWELVLRAADDEETTATEIVLRALKLYFREYRG